MDPIGEPARDRRQEDRDDGLRGQEQRGPGGGQVPGDLRIQHEGEHHRRDREPDRRDRDVSDGEVPVPEQAQRHERIALHPLLPPDERDEQDRPDDEQERDRDRTPDPTPAVAVPLLDREHSREQAHRAQGDPDPVEGAGVGLQGGHEPPGQVEADDPDGDVDEEHPLPAEPVEEHPAEDRADDGRQRSRPTGPSCRAGRQGKVRVMTAIVCGVIIGRRVHAGTMSIRSRWRFT